MNFKKTYAKLFLFFSFVCAAQTDTDNFLNAFSKGDHSEKLKLTANLHINHLKQVYPLIKDSLSRIKLRAYETNNSEAKFLLDMIDANIELANKNYAKTIFISENCIRNHARDVNDSLACYSIQKGAFVKIRNFFKAYEINSRMEMLLPRKSDSAMINPGIKKSSLYASLGFINKAIQERRKEFSGQNGQNDTEQIYNFYSDLGIYFNRLKLSDSAAIFFLKALELLEHKKFPDEQKVHYEFLKGVTKGNLGLSYFNINLPEKAIPLLKEDIYYSGKSGNYESLFLGHKLIAECYIQIGNFSYAEKHIDSATQVLKNFIPDGIMKQHLFFVKSKFYEAKGDHKKANIYLNRYFAFRDSLALIEKEQNIKNTEIAIKIEEKERELAEKNKILEQKELNQAHEKTLRAYYFSGILLLLGIVLFLSLIYYFSKKREKELSAKNEQIRKQNFQIEQSLKEKNILIKEIHHRVKNNLQIIISMLGLQITKEEGKESENTLRETRQRIGSIALTHQMLYQNPNLADIRANEYIENLVRQIERSIPSSNIEVVTALETVGKKVNIDSAVPLGLLVNELLTNCFKHAFPNYEKGFIKVSMRETENNCVIEISDNGVGLPEDFNFAGNKSMGMELIHILSEQLEAKLTIVSKNGSKFIIEIPKNKLFLQQ